ncbi:MAG: hypothetical protein MJ069_00280 [Salinivirgaceae bacterium]|nr:hypothetical protein [Salinivirgaceae bacterium]
MINQEADYIRSLICRFPEQQKDWIDKIDSEFKKLAQTEFPNESDSAYQMYRSYSSAALDSCELEKDMFYKSMFLMTYIYYESALKKIFAKSNVNKSLEYYISTNHLELKQATYSDYEFVKKYAKALRDHLCHNGYGEEYKVEKITSKLADYPEVSINEDGVVTITDSKFILDVLGKEQNILNEIAERLGFKNKII